MPDVMDALGEYLTGSQYNRRRLEVIARTNATTAFNQGRMEMFRQNADFVKAVRFMAILDSRVSDICESRDGRIMLLDDPAVSENTPPLHYNCRSVLSPVDVFEWEEMQAEGKDEDGNDLKELTDWSKVEKPQKGFGNVEKALREKAEKRKAKQLADVSDSGKSGGRNSRIEKTEKRRDKVSEKSERDIAISENNIIKISQYGFNEEELRVIEDTLRSLPSNHLNGLKSIEVSNSLLERVGDKATANGFYSVDEKMITLTRYPKRMDRRFRVNLIDFKGTLHHEIGHHYHYTKLIENSGLTNRFQELQLQMLRNKDAVKSMGFSTNLEFDEFFADLYRQSRVKYDIIIRVNDQFPGLNLKSLVDEVFGG